MAIKKKRVSPRQKMINLMYIVLMAMLALNVSSDVLNGIVLVDESLTRSTENSTSQNNSIYATLDEAMKLNPEKTREWYNKAQVVKSISDSLYNFAELLKWDIVRQSNVGRGFSLMAKFLWLLFFSSVLGPEHKRLST